MSIIDNNEITPELTSFDFLQNGVDLSTLMYIDSYTGQRILTNFKKNGTSLTIPAASTDSWKTNSDLDKFLDDGNVVSYVAKGVSPRFHDLLWDLSVQNDSGDIKDGTYRLSMPNSDTLSMYRIDTTTGTSRWLVSSYTSSDFRDNVIPRRILVIGQAGGGGGSGAVSNGVGAPGGGGGSGSCFACIIDLDTLRTSTSKSITFQVGKGGIGTQGHSGAGASASAGGTGGSTLIKNSSGVILITAFGGTGGSAHDASNGGAKGVGGLLEWSESSDWCFSGFYDGNICADSYCQGFNGAQRISGAHSEAQSSPSGWNFTATLNENHLELPNTYPEEITSIGGYSGGGSGDWNAGGAASWFADGGRGGHEGADIDDGQPGSLGSGGGSGAYHMFSPSAGGRGGDGFIKIYY